MTGVCGRHFYFAHLHDCAEFQQVLPCLAGAARDKEAPVAEVLWVTQLLGAAGEATEARDAQTSTADKQERDKPKLG